jgi:hypothetical protein
MKHVILIDAEDIYEDYDFVKSIVTSIQNWQEISDEDLVFLKEGIRYSGNYKVVVRQEFTEEKATIDSIIELGKKKKQDAIKEAEKRKQQELQRKKKLEKTSAERKLAKFKRLQEELKANNLIS